MSLLWFCDVSMKTLGHRVIVRAGDRSKHSEDPALHHQPAYGCQQATGNRLRWPWRLSSPKRHAAIQQSHLRCVWWHLSAIDRRFHSFSLPPVAVSCTPGCEHGRGTRPAGRPRTIVVTPPLLAIDPMHCSPGRPICLPCTRSGRKDGHF
jgi:hypothetical protein